MKLGIIGKGVVGTAIGKGFEHIGHSVFYHDIKLNTSINEVLNTDIVYICVGTPSTDEGDCDISAVHSVIEQLDELQYEGIVAIKSTVEPGTTKHYIDTYPELTFCFVPEFLREKYAYEDFVHNNNVLIVGTSDENVYSKIVESHGNLPVHKVLLEPTEAELMKYFSNTYKAMRVIFANAYYQIAQHFGVNYDKIKDGFLLHGVQEGHYLKVNEDFGLGYGGMCLPKDTNAMKRFVEKNSLDIDVFKFLQEENKKYKSK